MNLLKIITAATLISFFSSLLIGQVELPDNQKEMNGAGLEAIIRGLTDEDKISVNQNVIEFSFEEVPLYCIYDEGHNRMRIISPIVNYSLIPEEGKDLMMKSNFHAALDARYCVSGEILYAAFIHPLSTLERGEVLSAIYQVASLHLSFGTAYSSGLLSFGGEETGNDEDPI